MVPTFKMCTLCLVEKSHKHFLRSTLFHGLADVCLECIAIRHLHGINQHAGHDQVRHDCLNMHFTCCQQECAMCMMVKAPGDFAFNRASASGLVHVCKVCYDSVEHPAWWTEENAERLRVGSKVRVERPYCLLLHHTLTSTMQVCHTCYQLQPLTSFVFDRRAQKHYGRCRTCAKTSQDLRNALHRAEGTNAPQVRVRSSVGHQQHAYMLPLPQGRATGDTLPLPTADRPSPYKYTASSDAHQYRWKPSFGANRSTGILYDSALLAGLAGEAFHRNQRGQYNRAWDRAGVPNDAWGPGDAVDFQRALQGMAGNALGQAHVQVHNEQREARHRHVNVQHA